MPAQRAETFQTHYLVEGEPELSEGAILDLRSVTARGVVDGCVQAMDDQPRRRDQILGRATEVIRIWSAGDPARRAELFTTLATSPPYLVTTQEETARDWSIDDLLEDAFSQDELLAGLNTFQSVVANPSLSDLTGIRRTIPALRGKMRTGREEISMIGDETERRRVVSVLLPFLDLPDSSLGGYKLSCIAEIIIGMTPGNAGGEIADNIWWLGLLVNEGNAVHRRAVERVSSWIEADDKENLAHITGPLQQIPLDYEHRSIWGNLNEIFRRKIAKRPGRSGDQIFQILAGKFTFEDEARGRELHPSSAGDVCGVLDQLLTCAQEGIIQNEIISPVDSFNLALKTLQFYLQTKPNADNWLDRTWMMNLVEGLTFVYPQIAADEQIKSLVTRAIEQPDEDFSPFDDFARSRARVSEKVAVLIINARGTFPGATEGILGSV